MFEIDDSQDMNRFNSILKTSYLPAVYMVNNFQQHITKLKMVRIKIFVVLQMIMFSIAIISTVLNIHNRFYSNKVSTERLILI